MNLAVGFERAAAAGDDRAGDSDDQPGGPADAAGGTLAGDQTLYYAVTGGDASGQESSLSFVVRATIPAGTNTNSVTLSGLSFSSDATRFHVYRGTNPSQLLRIAADQTDRHSVHGYRTPGGVGASTGCELRSCQSLLAAGVAAGVRRDDSQRQYGGQ